MSRRQVGGMTTFSKFFQLRNWCLHEDRMGRMQHGLIRKANCLKCGDASAIPQKTD